MRSAKWESFLRRVNESYRWFSVLKLFCYLATAMCVLVFGYLFAHFLQKSPVIFVEFLVILGAPMVIVDLLRRFIDAPRPYQVYDFFTTQPKRKLGASFPSRHAFSAFVIGTVCFFVFPVIGIVTLILATLMCFARVLLGIHFVRDVVCGALVGIISGIIGVLIIY